MKISEKNIISKLHIENLNLQNSLKAMSQKLQTLINEKTITNEIKKTKTSV